MPGPNISINKTNNSYPAKPTDVPDAPQVVVQWDPSFANAKTLTFGLTVTDSLGTTSNQATVTVTIQQKPVAALVGPNGTTANNVVSAGSAIALDGSKSSPSPGANVKYTWTLVSQG